MDFQQLLNQPYYNLKHHFLVIGQWVNGYCSAENGAKQNPNLPWLFTHQEVVQWIIADWWRHYTGNDTDLQEIVGICIERIPQDFIIQHWEHYKLELDQRTRRRHAMQYL